MRVLFKPVAAELLLVIVDRPGLGLERMLVGVAVSEHLSASTAGRVSTDRPRNAAEIVCPQSRSSIGAWGGGRRGSALCRQLRRRNGPTLIAGARSLGDDLALGLIGRVALRFQLRPESCRDAETVISNRGMATETFSNRSVLLVELIERCSNPNEPVLLS